MTKRLDPDDLVNAQEAAPLLGLNNPSGVSVYRKRYADFPAPAIEKGMCVLWLRQDIERWAKARRS